MRLLFLDFDGVLLTGTDQDFNLDAIQNLNELIPLLTESLVYMLRNKDSLLAFNPSNGWGSFDYLEKFTKDLLNACKDAPEADIVRCR